MAISWTRLLSGILGVCVLGSTVLASGAASESGDEPACWEAEIDPRTRKPYRSGKAWEDDYKMITSMAPPQPGQISLLMAYQVFRQRVGLASQFRSDKTKHCFIGCHIAYAVNSEAADYAGWYKEVQDLTDCSRSTRFELEDYAATRDGIEYAELNPDGFKSDIRAGQVCTDLCKKRFGR